MRHLPTIDNIDFSENAMVVLDVRSITQLLYMHSVVGHLFFEKKIILIWKGKESDLIKASELIDIPEDHYILDINSQDKSLILNFNNIRKIRSICRSIYTPFRKIQILTSYASGMYFELLKSTLLVDDDDIVQFDDGLANEIVEINRYRFLRLIIYLMHNFYHFPSKYRLFSDYRFKKIYTSINPKNIIGIKDKKIVDISNCVSKNFKKISLNCLSIINSQSAILMSTHSVESKRMTRQQYQKLIEAVYLKLKEAGAMDVYLSKHPTEKNSNDEFYRKIGLILTYHNIPSELLVANKNINYIANPINSTIIISAYLEQLNGIQGVVSYIPSKSVHEKERVDIIKKILLDRSIKHSIF
ncbi:hypothetical protein HOB87_04125 [Candidatus Woesearchaeota archaeon]|nr:hypothetical protein [Candidatus Woesearchaeota archaeon]